MPEKQQPEKVVSLRELRSSVTEILVANGRSFQPFIKTFSHTGENIAKSNLGTLIGVFEIDEMTEDCAYIVNFLASVAKKEYFNNPRRGAIESFEAALHKINLALSELVKHGNISWLGKFHGALGVLEKNNIHFSITGQATVLLLRNDSISDISIGLASPESHTHPIKTFVEISSGRLALHDRIFFTSPELLALFSLEDLTKNAKRMNNTQFTQFLKTALVNELDMAGMLLIDASEEILPVSLERKKKTSTKKSQERISNIFSEKAFTLKKSNEVSPTQDAPALAENTPSEKNEEYIDTKTGHIYVQGDKPKDSGGNPRFAQISFHLEAFFDTTKFFLLAQSKWIHKGKRQLMLLLGFIGEETMILGRKTTRLFRKQWKKIPTTHPTEFTAQPETVYSPKKSSDSPTQEKKSFSSASSPAQTTFFLKETAIDRDSASPKHRSEQDISLLVKKKLASFYQNPVTPLTSATHTSSILNGFRTRIIHTVQKSTQYLLRYSQHMHRFSRSTCSQWCSIPKTLMASPLQKIFQSYRALPSKRKVFLEGSVIILCLGIIVFFFFTDHLTRNTPSSPATNPSPQSPDHTPNTLSNSDVSLIWDNIPDHIITSLILNNETYIITEKNILSVTDKKSFPLPGDHKTRFATAMDDLNLIFVYMENDTLYAWSPFSKTFAENTLALTHTSSITDIGTYLTYLYVLESESNQIYRFPRAHTGFGTSIPWLKETLPIESTSHLAVNENLFIAPDASTIKGFFRGRMTHTFETPASGLILTDLYTHPGLANIYGLDREHQKIYIWNQDGKLLQELFHEKFSDGQTLSVNEKSGEIFISTENSLLLYKLKK